MEDFVMIIRHLQKALSLVAIIGMVASSAQAQTRTADIAKESKMVECMKKHADHQAAHLDKMRELLDKKFQTRPFRPNTHIKSKNVVRYVVGDVDGDKDVDLKDFSELKAVMDAPKDASIQPWRKGDLNGDAVVDLKDFSLLKEHMGKVVYKTRLINPIKKPVDQSRRDHRRCGRPAAPATDANTSIKVDLKQFSLFKKNFGKDVPAYTEGDLTGDGKVGLADFDVIKSKFGQTIQIS